jgi:hypothetical protein
MRGRRVTRAEIALLRSRTPKPAIPFLVIRTIVDPRPDGLPPVIGPPATQEAMIAAAWVAIGSDGKSRRLILDGADAHG